MGNLRGLVPDQIIEEEIGSRVDEFESDIERARKTIPSGNLNKIFPPELEKQSIKLENFLGHWGNEPDYLRIENWNIDQIDSEIY